MKRVNNIMQHPVYRKELDSIHKWELDRIYCKHGLEHQLEVARLAYIISLEEGLMLDKELIYAAALLHDIGRAREYQQGIPHEQASVSIAIDILETIDFSEQETNVILDAIKCHRNESVLMQGRMKFGKTLQEKLSQALFLADKRCRNCFVCAASDTCKWSEDRKNREIIG